MDELKLLTAFLENRLKLELPGKASHMKMVPEIRFPEFDTPPVTPRNSSVLILLYPKGKHICIVVIQRPEYPGVHSGQVSFPGGKADERDSSIEATALREAQEEVDVNPDSVHVIGRLSPLFVSPSNFMIYPVVGVTSSTPVFKGDEKEVAAIYNIRLNDIISGKCIQRKSIKLHRGIELVTPFYDIQGLTIWGATAMILSEFSDVVKEFSGQLQELSSIS
ncbi:MAG: CoA pyrophosphatase [Bacteroidota bacterium]